MNLADAIKSGKPYRRKSNTSNAHYVFQIKGGKFWYTEMWADQITAEDILADDWEVEEKSVTITPTQFWEAAKRICKTSRIQAGPYDPSDPDSSRKAELIYAHDLARELGVEK